MLEFMRLRAIRVAADVGLSVGSMSVAQATQYFASQVPMSTEEAEGEVSARLEAPGQGLSYVIGKEQLFHYLQAAKLDAQSKSKTLDLLKFHASIEENGNLPFVLQMHAAGLNTSLQESISDGFENLHSAFDGVDASRMTELQTAPELVHRLPGAPAGPAPVMLSGYEQVADLAAGEQDRQLFWLLVHSSASNSSGDHEVPLVIWLQGGNGCSSMIGAFTENGPYYSPVQGSETDGATSGLLTNEHSLHHLAHVLYLDRPADAGFSYSGGAPNISWANDKQTALDGLAALRGVLKRFPWLGGRQVWVAGESYAGHFTVQLATDIANAEPTLPAGTTLGGVICGNGVVDINQTNYAWFEAGYTHSLVDEQVWRGMQKQCDFTKDLGIDGNGCPQGVSDACASLVSGWMNQSGSARNLLSLYDCYADVCLTSSSSSPSSRSSYGMLGAMPVDACADSDTGAYLNHPAVRAALHVSPKANPKWEPCNQALNNAYSCPDTLVSVAPLYSALLQDTRRKRRLLIYSGDVDGVVPTLATRRWIAAMGGKAKVAGWRLWQDSRGQIGGYTEAYKASASPARSQESAKAPAEGELVFATVRGAGHMVPTYQPLRAFELFRAFLRDEPLPA